MYTRITTATVTNTNYTLLVFTANKLTPTGFGNSTISYDKRTVTLSQKKAALFEAVHWTCCYIFVTKNDFTHSL